MDCGRGILHKRQRRASLARRLGRWSVRLAGSGLLVLALLGGYFWVSTDLPAPRHLRARAARGNTRILDRHGRLLYQVPDPFSGWREPVSLDEIPLALRQATIAVEDSQFYQNVGIDMRGVARAAWVNLRSGAVVAGGSTITQQLARNTLLDPQLAQQRTLERKIRETVLALKLTTQLPKDDILALYMNQTYYGGMAYGVEAAAQHYFGKPARDLDLAECALLAGLPQAPSAYNPLVNREAALSRQGQVLAAMVREGFISPARAEAARAEPLQFGQGSLSLAHMQAPHVVFYVLDQVVARYGSEAVARGGLTITTTLDLNIQQAAQASLSRQVALLSRPPDPGEPDHQVRNGAVVVLDPADGAILAMVGSPDFSDATIYGEVNAARALRQPGSAIKPLTYAAALEQGWTPATPIDDVPSSFPTREGRPYIPQNYDRTYQGTISLREALATSSNVAAVQVLNEIGVPALLDMARRLGITTLSEDSGRYGLALTLGGGDVTLLELTTAYAAFANGGYRVVPHAILAVDTPGEKQEHESKQWATQEQRTRALSPQVAYLISDILSDRYARMRAFGERSVLDVDRPAAVKTGTTTDWRDNWTVGYTPDRVVGVWVGNADGQAMEAVSGIDGAGPVWHEVMLAAHRYLPPRPFEPPEGVVEVAVCGESTPAARCAAPRLERFVAATGNEAQEENRAQTRALERRNMSEAGQALTLVAPAPGALYSFGAGIPRERQHITMEVRASDDAAKVIIVLDDKQVAAFTAPPYRFFWSPVPGNHRAFAKGWDEQGRTWKSDVVEFRVADTPM